MANLVRDNPSAQRYELDADGKLAFVTYRLAPGVVTLLHAQVPAELSHHGIGSALVQGALELIRARGYKVVARCRFVARYIERHAEYRDLLSAAPLSS